MSKVTGTTLLLLVILLLVVALEDGHPGVEAEAAGHIEEVCENMAKEDALGL